MTEVNKGGRPKWIPKETDYQLIEDWCAEGINEGAIAMKLGIAPNTFALKKKEFPKIQDAINKGKFRDEELCVNLLRQIAFDFNHKGQMTALIFYLKSRHQNYDRPAALMTLPSNITLSKRKK